MKSLSINGQKLHEVLMLLVPYSSGTVAYLQYPKHRINYQVNENLLPDGKVHILSTASPL
jgi:hypothetical protein